MPNWCETDLYISGPNVDSVLLAIRGERRDVADVGRTLLEIVSETVEYDVFDFNKIIPMPPSLMVDDGTKSDLAVLCAKNEGLGDFGLYDWVKKAGYTTVGELCAHFGWSYEEMAAQGRILLENEEKYGARTWYDWSRKHWGTKWNVCGGRVVKLADGAKLTFETAWAPPLPVIAELAKKFPDHTFTAKYYEGGWGFKGVFKAKGEVVLEASRGSYDGQRGG